MSIATLPVVAKKLGINLSKLDTESDDRLLDVLYEAVRQARPEATQELVQQVDKLHAGEYTETLPNGTNIRMVHYDPDSPMGRDMMLICGPEPIRTAFNRHFSKDGGGGPIPGYRNGVDIILADGPVSFRDMMVIQMRD
jgi:hypothetical protein